MRPELPLVAKMGPAQPLLHELTAVRIQILYSGARTFLKQRLFAGDAEAHDTPIRRGAARRRGHAAGLHGIQGRCTKFKAQWKQDAEAAARTRPLFRHRRSAQADAAGKCPSGGLGDRQRGELGDQAANAADGVAAAARGSAAARPSELGMARIWHARRLLAVPGMSHAPQDRADAGFVQMPMHNLEDQRGAIRRTIEAITTFTGRRPRGWESPGLTETLDTADLLTAEGIEYVADWVLDDQPCQIATESGPLVSVPYPVEMNDVSMMAVGLHASDEWLKRGLRQFERLYQESASITRIMSISIHPYLTGVPHRIGYLEELLDAIAERDDVVFMTGEQILDWYLGCRVAAGQARS
jgi:hypothetical protein